MKDEMVDWVKLDNAAKYFPSSSNKRDTKVFRVACQLFENVDKSTLQKALDITIEHFPLYKAVLKKGVFWYYLESSDIKPVVEEENLPICYPLYDKSNESLLFRVSYFKKRINLEIYHALSDGAGGIEFIKNLIANYLTIKYPKEFKDKKIDLKFNASIFEKNDDSFEKYYDREGNKKRVKTERAYVLKGQKYPEQRLEVIEGIMNTKKVLELTKKYNTTVTVLMAAIFLKSINDNMKQKNRKRPVVITIPVNLRQYFKSYSTRNFFGVFNVGYSFKKYSNDLEDIISYLNTFFKEKLNYDQMAAIINSYVALEENVLIRSIPLILKNFGLWIASKYVDQRNTVSLSNLGRIEMPLELEKYIDYFDLFVSTNKTQICMNSYKDKMVVSFTSPFINTNIQKTFFNYFKELDVDVTIISNMGVDK